MASGSVKEELPPALDSSSDPPTVFDGTPKFYISYTCPYAQHVWIARDYKVPSLEHNNEVKGESLDLLKYVDIKFEGPPLLPDDPANREFAEELWSYIDSFSKAVISSFKGDGIGEAGSAFDHIENGLGKFDVPFFLGTFSLVDVAYAPFIERYQPFLLEVKNYDIVEGRPKLAKWIQVLDQNYHFPIQDPSN